MARAFRCEGARRERRDLPAGHRACWSLAEVGAWIEATAAMCACALRRRDCYHPRMAPSTVSAVLRRIGLGKLSRLEQEATRRPHHRAEQPGWFLRLGQRGQI